MVKTQIYFPEEDLEALRSTAKRSGRSVADLVREAVRRVWLRAPAAGRSGGFVGRCPDPKFH